MYGKKSNLEEELERLREKKARINAEQQAKTAAVNPPIKNDPEFKKAQQRKQHHEDHDSDGRYSDDLDDSSFNRNRSKNAPKSSKHPNNSGDHVSPRRHEKKISPRRHDTHQARSHSRHSSADKDRSLNPEKELKELEFGWKHTETLGSVPPNDYTITNITQNHDLLVKILKQIF